MLCVCVRFCLCVSSTSGIPRPGPLLQVWNEKSTLTLQKWIRKHGGHNYQAPSGWNWRRWSANRSVSNHPPPSPLLPALCNPVGVLELIWCQERPFTTTHRLAGRQAGRLVMLAGWVFGGCRRSFESWRSNRRGKKKAFVSHVDICAFMYVSSSGSPSTGACACASGASSRLQTLLHAGRPDAL